jgi:hypothetical protein
MGFHDFVRPQSLSYVEVCSCPDRYGRLDNVHVSESARILQGILREEWGFKGKTMSFQLVPSLSHRGIGYRHDHV